MVDIERALIVDEPWISKILSGVKTWEMRTRHTSIRGRVGLIRKGSGLIVGEAYLLGSIKPQTPLNILKCWHGIDYEKNPELAKYNIAWVMINAKLYKNPIPYKHPQGAVIWVKLNNI